MKRQYNSFLVAIKYTFYVLLLLSVVFIGATVVWIGVTPYTIIQFNLVLSKILKNAGPYSVLLVGIVITTFFQVYSKEKELQKEDKIKIGEVGYYTLAFKRQEDVYEEVYNGDKLVVEINEKSDYDFNAEEADRNRYFWLLLKCDDNDVVKKFWISAVTEEGVLLFVKVKARIRIFQENNVTKAKISLLQQTTYYESHNELCALYR